MFFKPKVVLVRVGRKMMVKHFCNSCGEVHFINKLGFSSISNVLCDNCLDKTDDIHKDEIVEYPQGYDIIGKESNMGLSMQKREFIPKRLREEIIEYYDSICQYCGEDCMYKGGVELDHIIPWSFGGSNERGNLVVSCGDCNRRGSNFFFPTFYDKYEYINGFYR